MSVADMRRCFEMLSSFATLDRTALNSMLVGLGE